MIKLLNLFLVLLISSNSNKIEYDNSTKSRNEIFYSEYKLKWTDFTEAKTNKPIAAIAATGIGYEASVVGEKVYVKVFCYFDKSQSYIYNGEKNKTDYILNHEQKHFDISYLFCLKFIKTLNKQNKLTAELIEKIYSNILIEKDNCQSKYDLETHHSKINQKIWDDYIVEQIKLYK
jgi:hypothetical protein